MVLDRPGITSLAVPHALGDSAPARQHLLRRWRCRQEMLDADRADDPGHQSRRGPGELDLFGQQLEHVVGIAGVHTARLDVTGDVCPGQTEFTWRGGQIGRTARSQQVHSQYGVFGSGATAVVGSES